jgi:hypothetical protein
MCMHVAELCVTRSGIAHLTFTCEVHSLNCPAYFRQLKMVAVVCYLVGDSCMFVRGFDGITLLFSNAPVSDVCSENSTVMLPKL